MVFVEFDRDENMLDKVKSIVSEVTNIAGKLDWEVKLPYVEEAIKLDDPSLDIRVQTNPELYLTAKEMKDKLAVEAVEAEEQALQEQAEENSNTILRFLEDSNLLEAGINDNKLHMRGSKNVATLEVVNFGPAKDIMAELGIKESAIKPLDSTLRVFNSMLGEMKAVPIDDYIVIFNPEVTENILVTKQC